MRKLVALLALFTMAATAPLVASITPNDPDLHYGESVTFTAVYPQEAAKQARQPQYPDNPNIQVDCYQTVQIDGTYWTFHVFNAHSIIDKTTKQKIAAGWWQGMTYPVELHDLGYNGVWPNGLSPWDPTIPVTCFAFLYGGLVDNTVKVWASSQFIVSP